jgi:hypothetical protein
MYYYFVFVSSYYLWWEAQTIIKNKPLAIYAFPIILQTTRAHLLAKVVGLKNKVIAK